MKIRNHSASLVLLYFITFILIYFPTIFFDYVHHDGVLFLLRTPGAMEPHFHQSSAIEIGRYLAGYYLTFIGWMINTVSDIKYVRFFNILLMSLCAALTHEWFFIDKKRSLHNYCIITMVFTLASFQSLFSYSGNFPFLPALLFSIISAKYVLEIPLNGRGSRSFFSSQWASICFLLCALCFYPSLGMYYWFLAAAVHISASKDKGAAKQKRLLLFLSTGILAMFFYALLLKLMKMILSIKMRAGLYNPYSITPDPIGKMKWFLSEPIINSLNLWNIFPKNTIAIFVVFFILAAVLINRSKTFLIKTKNTKKEIISDNLAPLFWFCLLLILSFLPNLAAFGNAAWYRTLAALSGIILITVIWSLHQWTSLFPHYLRRRVLTICLLAGVISGSLFAHHNVLAHRVLPSYREYQYIKHIIDQSVVRPNQHIHAILPSNVPDHARYDEFGVISSHVKTNLDSLVIGAFRDLGREEEIEKHGVWLSKSRFDESFHIDPSTILIDLREL